MHHPNTQANGCILQWVADAQHNKSRGLLGISQVTVDPATSSKHHFLSTRQLPELTFKTSIHCRSQQKHKRYLSLTAKASRQSSAVGVQKVAVAEGATRAHPVQWKLCASASKLSAD